MKYKVINSDLFLNGQLIPEGSTIELSESQSEGITSYLQPLEENLVPNNVIPYLIRDQKNKSKTCPELVSGTKRQSNIKKEKLK